MAKAAHHAHPTVKSNQVDPEVTATWFNNLVKDVESGKHNWDLYDNDTPIIVSTYNSHLSSTPGYTPLDWKLIKAQTWVESGPTARYDAWIRNPMQIGNPGDPGLKAILTTPHGKLIMPHEYQQLVTLANAVGNGRLNIMAGVGYLLQRFAIFDMIPESPLSTVNTKTQSDSRKESTAVDTHRKKHTKTHIPPQKKRLAIVGWRLLNCEAIAKLYNARMSDYSERLEWCYQYIKGEIR